MDEERRKQIAQFRYEVIAPLLHSREKGTLQAALEAAAQRVYVLPDGTQRRLSVRTLERYLSLYRRGGFEALYPAGRSDHSRPRALPQAIIDRAIALRKEQPARTVEQIIAMLEMEGLAAPGFIRRSTLAAHLRKAGVPRARAVRKQARAWQRYTASEVHEIWQCDVCDSLRVPDVDAGGQMRVARLVAVLDDKSRYICYAAFYFRENLPVIEDALKKAIAAHGTPRIFYCDNAKVYHAGQLTEIAARLGFEIRHTRPYSPQGRGKIEKFFGYVERSFRPEAELCVRKGTIQSLDDLNRYFWAWLEQMYHQRVHTTLKKRPADVLATHGPLRLVEPQVLEEAFLWTYGAKADKTACVSVQGNTYEVEPVLAGKKVQLRYNPFDLRRIQVWYEGRRYADAVPMTLRRHVDKRVETSLPDKAEPLPAGISFLEHLEQREANARKERLGRIQFSAARGDEG